MDTVKSPSENKDDREQSSATQSFMDRLRKVKTTRWIRFGIVSAIYIFWVILMGNPWLLFFWLILADIYITGFVPWGWWKKHTGLTRSLMAWVDAIVYALVLIYFVFAFIGQQYEIPSSSLEKTLLVGDRLWVDKATFGARVPQTPIHFPLAQHTMPILGTKSYLDQPQLEYHRLPGLRSIERGDIVVFNYPQGDTVATKIPNPDYYQISYELRKNGVGNPLEYIKSNPQMFGEVVVRPVDRRENYVKRTIGLPGERIRISNDSIYINGVSIKEPADVQYNYIVPVSKAIPAEKWKRLGVRLEDVANGPETAQLLGFKFYDIPLTASMKAEIEKWPEVNGPLTRERESGMYDLGNVWPLGNDYGWTRDNMGEFWIPKRGVTLHLTPENYPLYERAIRTYEGNDLKMTADGKIFINGKETEYYTFKMDYYWMQGDNRDRSADSRYWGFVPEDHIVGEPVFVIISMDQDKSLSEGKIRWDRIFKKPNPDGKL